MSPVFDPGELGQHLATTPVLRLHDTHGNGFRYALGPDSENPAGDLEVYPDARVIRYSAEGLAITVRSGTMGATYDEDGVIFADRTGHRYRHLSIARSGDVVLFTNTITDALPQSEPPTLNTPTIQPDTEHQTSPETGERVIVTGRAGREPRLAETKTGIPVAKFPLAEKVEEGTIWHNVVAFKSRAHEVSETVKKGQEYKVVGYRHTRKDGRGKDITEIYAASVKPPSRKSGGGDTNGRE